jgi:hypothetical protein
MSVCEVNLGFLQASGAKPKSIFFLSPFPSFCHLTNLLLTRDPRLPIRIDRHRASKGEHFGNGGGTLLRLLSLQQRVGLGAGVGSIEWGAQTPADGAANALRLRILLVKVFAYHAKKPPERCIFSFLKANSINKQGLRGLDRNHTSTAKPKARIPSAVSVRLGRLPPLHWASLWTDRKRELGRKPE